MRHFIQSYCFDGARRRGWSDSEAFSGSGMCKDWASIAMNKGEEDEEIPTGWWVYTASEVQSGVERETRTETAMHSGRYMK
ncbi:predicted protein [Sclerotinia sclerotiorum 1980 UF-70]|uniref:Uncharacterized protein n=1 Tax=Sclerotinia sclerotiorum (strain ATCC 18683 / 1980 / Ss-1) TaxID=665079 RepID=A7EDQ6_SCLS1|nr:predicted protein [Sclerotinia sclerotiorum 1980 UF-70]EDO00972.1 predicted protein [Sclerotinia sclerotiorum 1980 UF-70]